MRATTPSQPGRKDDIQVCNNLVADYGQRIAIDFGNDTGDQSPNIWWDAANNHWTNNEVSTTAVLTTTGRLLAITA